MKFIIITILLFNANIYSAVKLNSLFSDGMILQRDKPVNVWGMAAPKANLTITFKGKKAACVADGEGKWKVQIGPFKASKESAILTVSGDNSQTIKNVTVGEVWVASGQSNMQYTMNQTIDGKKAVPMASHTAIKFFHRAKGERSYTWQSVTPKNAGELSAVAYFFSKNLNEKYDIPIGIIVRAVGGTTIQRWTSAKAFSQSKVLAEKMKMADSRKDDVKKYFATYKQYGKKNKPTPEVQKWLTEMAGIAPFAGGIGGLYSRMIKPLQPFTIGGVIWYQGEFNNRGGQAYIYRDMQEALVKGWRQDWGQGDFPFLYVQMQVLGNTTTPLLRESQLTTVKRCQATAMAVICDQSNGLHPEYKEVAGERLATAAVNMASKSHKPMGPLLISHKQDGARYILEFDSEVVLKNGEARGIAICGPDKQFQVGTVVQLSPKVLAVSSKSISDPEAVRYCWLKDPIPHMTLFNRDGLPASPFRTDSFKDTNETNLWKTTVKKKKKK